MTKKITLEKLARMIQGGFKEAKDEAIEIKKELKGDITAVKSELKGDIAAVKSELKGDIKKLKNDVGVIKKDVKELKLTTQRIETRQEAEAMRHDRHSVLITDHGKRIKVLEKV